MDAHLSGEIGIAVTGLYLFVIGGIMQLFPNLGAKA